MEDEKADNQANNDPMINKDTDKDNAPAVVATPNEAKDYEELKDKMLRIAAEFDNYKKRTQNEVSRARVHGKVELIRQIIPVLDEFELAIISLQVTKRAKDGTNVFKGIEMVYANLKESLSKSGLSEIRTDGTFDPMSHEAIMTKSDESESGKIIEVVKKGYTFEGVLVRPASVIISSGEPKENND